MAAEHTIWDWIAVFIGNGYPVMESIRQESTGDWTTRVYWLDAEKCAFCMLCQQTVDPNALEVLLVVKLSQISRDEIKKLATFDLPSKFSWNMRPSILRDFEAKTKLDKKWNIVFNSY